MGLLACILFLGVFPVFIGNALFALLNKGQKDYFDLSRNYLFGYLLLWSVIEVLSIPITLMRLSFSIVVIITSAICLFFGVFGLLVLIRSDIIKRCGEGILSGINNKNVIIGLIILTMGVGVFLYKVETTYFFDEDDSRFIVNAIDIVKTNRILAMDPSTGLPLASNYDDFHKDLIGQWASFMAFSSKITGVHVTIFAHTVYPVISCFLLLSVLWQLFDLFDTDNKQSFLNKCLMEVIALGLYSFGYYSLRAPETFTIIRVWQGKASLASIGVLLIIMAFMIIYREKSYKYGFVVLLLTVLSACLMTSMGVIISGCMIAMYGLAVSFLRKDIKILLLSAAVCIPVVCLFLISKLYTLEMFLN